MQDRQLYAQILGIPPPWRVEDVELRLAQGEVHIYLGHRQGGRWRCPRCQHECRLYDHQPERVWRHLDTCQYRTIVHAQPPRSDCPDHGPLVVKLPWADPGSHFTALLEALAIDWLQAASQKAVGERLGLSWDEVHGIMQRAVKRGLERRQAEPLTYLGVDEKSFRKGHRYLTVVADLERSRVLHVAADRRQASLDEFWPTLSDEQRAGMQAIAMDMWHPYITSVQEHLEEGDGKIVFDKFHIAGHLGQAVDRVRRREHKQLRQQGDLRLVGSKYDWLRHPARFSQQAWREFRALRDSNLKTARAGALKETLMRLFDYRYQGAARSFFRRWFYWATHSRLRPVIEVARTLQRRLENILTYLRHRITNATTESLNAKIRWVKYTARGFRNQKNFITAIYFHCGGLELAPSPT